MAEEADTSAAAPPQTVLNTDNVSSFLDLQTEFIKRRDAAISGKQAKTTSSSVEYAHRSTKNNILAMTKEEKKSKMEVSEMRTQRIRQNEAALLKEEQERIRQRRILEQKAAIYERMAKGEKLMYEDGKEAEFLVDFHAKKHELENDERDKPGTSSTDDGSDELTRRWEPAPLIVHYDYTEDKGRVFGASHVPLPTMDEDAREQRIKELKTMTEETQQKRAERKKQKDAEKAEEKGRLNRLRERMGLEPIPSSDEEEVEKDAGEDNQQETDVAEIPLPPSPSSVVDAKQQEKNRKGPVEEKKKPLRYGVREWDRGKVGYMRWIEGQREEREEEFAPPSSYYEDDLGGAKRRRK